MNYLVFTNCLVACFVLGIFAVDYVKIPLPVLYLNTRSVSIIVCAKKMPFWLGC